MHNERAETFFLDAARLHKTTRARAVKTFQR